METSTGEVFRLLQDLSDGSREALDKLLPLVYEELRRLAHSYLSRAKSPISIPGSPLARTIHE